MFQHNRYGSPDEYDVEPDVPVADVPGIHLDPFVIGGITAAAGLPHAGDAGTDHVEVFDVFAVFGNFGLDNGARADEAHFSFEDVEQLWQFVQACLAQECATPGDARVVFEFEFFFPFPAGFRVFCQQFFELDIGIDAHAAEFIAVEFFSMASDAAVFEYDGSWRVFVYPEGYSQENRAETDNADAGTDNIECPLEDTVVPPGHVVADLERYDVPVDECFHIEGCQRHGTHIGNKGDVFDFGLQPVYNILHFVVAQARRNDQDMLDTGLVNDSFGIGKGSQMRHEL